MHELTIVSSLIGEVLNIAHKNNLKKVEKIVVEIGELTFLSEDSLRLTFEILREEYDVVNSAELEIHKIPAKLMCERCGYSGRLESKIDEDNTYHFYLPILTCPTCGSELRVVEGRDCVLRKIIFFSD